MERNLSSDFEAFSNRVLQYHSHIVSLISGIVIGILTNYFITYVFPLPYWYGLILSILLLILSSYVFLLYSPQIIRGQAVETIPKTLHEFLYRNFDNLLSYIRLDLEGFAFHKKVRSYNAFMASMWCTGRNFSSKLSPRRRKRGISIFQILQMQNKSSYFRYEP